MSSLRKVARWFRQAFCNHAWRLSKYQALVPGWSDDCPKCGKRRHREFER